MELVITSLTTFTDDRDPWTTPKANEDAQRLLSTMICEKEDEDEDEMQIQGLLVRVLESRIKPVFQKVKNPAITEQGRKAIHRVPQPLERVDVEGELKSWKFQDVYIVTVFRWILNRLSTATLVENWPLVIPPLLAVLDDEDIDNKVKGCELLSCFLRITPSSLLLRTGLGEVFHDTLVPCLSFLPTLTPEDKSLQLLNAVYPTLMKLTRARYSGDQAQQPKSRYLDGILRVGVLQGYAHAGEHVKIGEMLLNHLRPIVHEMGMESVKNLKILISLLLSVLSSPFGTLYPPLQITAVQALDAVMLTCWPRIGFYRGSILKGLTLCWCRIKDSESLTEELYCVERSLRKSCLLMKAILNSSGFDFTEETAMLSASDDRLIGLFET